MHYVSSIPAAPFVVTFPIFIDRVLPNATVSVGAGDPRIAWILFLNVAQIAFAQDSITTGSFCYPIAS
jgi:hypothetical protein